ncbi:MAG: TolC family protein [Nitrospirae bacterium]|nr:MAG: TolC family protein [Nitrospirota bacterium]
MKTSGYVRFPQKPEGALRWILLITLILGLTLSMSPHAPAAPQPPPQASQEGPEYQLADIITMALERNPRLSVGEGLIAEKTGRLRSSQAYPNPTFSFQSGRGSVRDPSVGMAITERYVMLRQPLEWPGMRAADQQAAREGVTGAEASLETAKLDLIVDVKKAFYDLLLAQRRLTLSSENLATIEQWGQAIETRVQAGDLPAIEAVNIALERQKEEAARTQAEGDRLAAQTALDALTAGALGQAFSVRGEFPSPSLTLDAQHLVNEAKRRHPRLIRLRHLVEEGRHLKIREEQARIPTMTLEGAYQRDAGREAVVGSLSLPLPLWDQRQGEIAQAAGSLRQREALLLGSEQEVAKAINQQLQQVKTAIAHIKAYEDGFLRQAREARRLAEVSFKYGEVSLLEVLDAHRQYRQALMNYAQTRYELAVALAKLERLVGQELSEGS